jgi:hypothetical protein
VSVDFADARSCRRWEAGIGTGRDDRRIGQMKQYLLSVYHPETEPPDNIDEIMRDVEALNEELREAEGWVFAAETRGHRAGDRGCAP